ncbi:hypothetical protein PCH_Pc21g09490 [Penicillium rubens Wisconsin 54-1255]|uniref:Uncharacterized protein n=1 Tax=Penicillium rubens (strain ATCC 28089 / DSM 1075 / NRRL 1951 / Wisconsin 54-1255) TaxID=500485 RepID=B6HNN4_PENRW|nr:hypothetical protein PCH_Pc21g09490 [Penicillium rubens Wisconsin 54-1255]
MAGDNLATTRLVDNTGAVPLIPTYPWMLTYSVTTTYNELLGMMYNAVLVGKLIGITNVIGANIGVSTRCLCFSRDFPGRLLGGRIRVRFNPFRECGRSGRIPT